MKPGAFLLLGALLGAGSLFGRADDANLSPERLRLLEERGYFTPAFKAAVHDLIDSQQAVVQAQADEEKMRASLPGLRQASSAATARVADLQKELDSYAHPEDLDFDALQKTMKDPATSSKDRLVLVQAFVWSYPTDPHQAEAQQDLQQVQKQIADEQKARRDAEAAQVAARARLIQRAQARDLSLNEWRDFLRDMSQEELLTYLGRPQTEQADCWIYSGAWTSDPVTKQKVGLQIFFNGTRVSHVAELPQSQQ